MKITVLVTLMVFLAYFLVLYGGVGFIQDKRFSHPHQRKIWTQFPIQRNDFPAHIVSAG